MLKEALDDFMLKILIGCAIFQLVIELSTAEPEDLSHAWIEGFAILLAVAVVSLVGATSDYKKEGQFLKQQELAENAKIVSNLSVRKTTTINPLLAFLGHDEERRERRNNAQGKYQGRRYHQDCQWHGCASRWHLRRGKRSASR